MVASSTTMLPWRLSSRPGVDFVARGLGPWPIAITIVSIGISYSDPSIGTGRRRPEASGSPSSMRWILRPVTNPSLFPRIATGAESQRKSIVSSSACSSSSRRAGDSLRVRR